MIKKNYLINFVFFLFYLNFKIMADKQLISFTTKRIEAKKTLHCVLKLNEGIVSKIFSSYLLNPLLYL